MTNKSWHVLYTKPRNEKKVTQRLAEQGFEVYCPLIETIRQWSDRKKKVRIPLFNSYVFIKLDEVQRRLVLRDPGVLNFVFWLGKPALVLDREIDAIKFITLETEQIEVSTIRQHVGDIIVIPEGPFRGLKGVVDTVDKNQVILYIEALQCKIQFKYSKQFLLNKQKW